MQVSRWPFSVLLQQKITATCSGKRDGEVQRKRMRWSIFSRLMTGYLVLLVLVTGVSVYAITQLGYVRDVTRSVIVTDNPLLDLHKSLSDALLSEQRYEKKYVIMRDPALYRGFSRSRGEFEHALGEAEKLAEAADLKKALARIADLHLAYQALFLEESGHIRAGRRYAAGWYEGKKERLANMLSEELAGVRSISQQSMIDKVKRLGEAGTRATSAVMITTGAALGVGVILSVLITSG